MDNEYLLGQKPLIIVGMHRSGTSMLSRYIDEIGYFTGVDKQQDNESEFFIDINTWILSQYNATWDNPTNYQFTNDHMDGLIQQAVVKRLNSFWLSKYLGASRYLKYRDISNFDFKWGWKDPRSSITLDVWKRIFGEFKMVHIHRNPMDIALSLKHREEKRKANFEKGFSGSIKEFLFKGKVGYQPSPRVEHIEESYKLWLEYTNAIFEFENKNRGIDVLHVKYESFLDDPKSIMVSISEFLEIPINEVAIAKFEQKIDSKNKNKFINNSSVMEFYEKIKNDDLMVSLGYNKF